MTPSAAEARYLVGDVWIRAAESIGSAVVRRRSRRLRCVIDLAEREPGAPGPSGVLRPVRLITSPHLIAELIDVVHRDKFRSRFSRSAADQMLRAVRLLAELHPDPDVSNRKPVCRDPKDEYLFVLAEASGGTLLVSGDRDVLETSYGAVAVMRPHQALDSIR